MNTLIFFLLWILLFLQPKTEASYIAQSQSIFDTPVMCAETTGRCTGSAYCNVCTNCSRCGYCKSGGSCGVCGKKSIQRSQSAIRTTPVIKYENTYIKPKSSNVMVQPNEAEITYFVDEKYKLTVRTSLRVFPSSQSTVLYRFQVDDMVTLLDDFSEKYWAKVVFKGDIGWVKKHLLLRLRVVEP